MTSPLQPIEEDKRESVSPGDSFYGRPSVVLLDEKQWSYIQRRYRMSPREVQVAKLVCQGFTNGDIAKRLKVQPGTVKTHLRSIFSKTHAHNKITMLLRCLENAGRFSARPKDAAPFPTVEQNPTPKSHLPGEMLIEE